MREWRANMCSIFCLTLARRVFIIFSSVVELVNLGKTIGKVGKTLVSTGLLTFDANPAVKACVNLDLSNWLKTKRLFILTILFNVPRNSFKLNFLFSEFWFAKIFYLRIKNEKWHLQHLSLPFFSGLGFKCFKCVTIERLLSKPNLQKQSQKQFAAPQNRLPIFAKCFFCSSSVWTVGWRYLPFAGIGLAQKYCLNIFF